MAPAVLNSPRERRTRGRGRGLGPLDVNMCVFLLERDATACRPACLFLSPSVRTRSGQCSVAAGF